MYTFIKKIEKDYSIPLYITVIVYISWQPGGILGHTWSKEFSNY